MVLHEDKVKTMLWVSMCCFALYMLYGFFSVNAGLLIIMSIFTLSSIFSNYSFNQAVILAALFFFFFNSIAFVLDVGLHSVLNATARAHSFL